MNYILPIAAVLIGFSVVYFFPPANQKNLKLLLAFSGGFLLAVTVFNLLPEVFKTHQGESHASGQIGLWIMSGILLQSVLEYFSQGAEHGHVHLKQNRTTLPQLLFFSLGIHALLEGFPIHHTEGLLAGVVVHKIPVAMILSTYLLQTKIKKWQIILFLVAFSLLTPLGSYIAATFTLITKFYQQITALVVGIFLHVSTTILFESNEGHKFNVSKFLVILFAIALAYFI